MYYVDHITLEVAKQLVCMSVSCRDHYTNIIVAVPIQHCNYYVHVYTYFICMYNVCAALAKCVRSEKGNCNSP